ncbi:MAG: aminoacyl-tRNA hydrolase [Euryarchaeota archaeon RBG_13_61_15]|jgi:PTH2 family peptidyl-tRNA hydrolase|nr:MAG: aminoacyl-tRNA hydrolase [Euryarchaeota archaeon RBG_13_61_15]
MGPRKGEMEYKLVVVVRDDLKMSGGKLAAQVAHAAVTCALEAKARKTKWFSAWYAEGQRKVVLRARDLEELRILNDKASRAGLPRTLITDAGLTELPPNTTTCLGIGPAPEGEIDQITGHLPLA